MFDGSSIRGFQAIHESDMKLDPGPDDAPTSTRSATEKTLIMNFSIVDPFTDEPYSRDPRNIAAKAEAYLKSTGIADTAYFGAEAEFYVFDDVRFETKQNASYYYIDSDRGGLEHRPRRGGRQQAATRPATRAATSPSRRSTTSPTCATRSASTSPRSASSVERSHHEVGTAGQQEINYRFNTLLQSGDDMMKFKYVVKNTAWEAGKTATFMPKPIFGDNGSGMHTHQSLWKDGEPLFYDERGYGGLSDLARWYIGGLLKHAPALLAFTNPTVNSYHRLVPGYEAPVNLVYSARNRSACVRIPIAGDSPKAKRIEFRIPDPSSNPYLALRGAADGRPRRHQEPHRAPGAGRQGPLRAAAGGARRHRAGPRLAARGARRPRGRPRVPARGRRLHPGPHRDLDRVEDARTRSTRSASARTRTSSRCTTTCEAHKPLTCINVSQQSSQSLMSPHEQPAPPPRRLVRTRLRPATCGRRC